MPKVIVGGREFYSIEEYMAALEAWEEFHAPFKAQAEALADEFIGPASDTTADLAWGMWTRTATWISL